MNREKGFTLVETMVTVIVFAAVMSLALGVFLSVVRNQRVAMHRQKLVTETSFLMSRIEEAVRKGEAYTVEDFHSDRIIVNKYTYPASHSGEDKVTVVLETEIKIGEDEKAQYRLQTTVLKN